MLVAKKTRLESEIWWLDSFINSYFVNTDKSPAYFKLVKDVLREVIKIVNGRTPVTGIKRENFEIKMFLAQNARSLFRGKRIKDINSDMLIEVKNFINTNFPDLA